MHPQAEACAQAMIETFWAADQAITWTGAEVEHLVWLDTRTALVGRIDALGRTDDSDPFFAEWKSASGWWKNRMHELKATWRFDPQALTYGVLGDSLIPGMRRFTVRWALKTNPVACHFEWYSYTTEEIAMWHEELLRIAQEVRALRSGLTPMISPGLRLLHWPLNPSNCFRYGLKYVCPFFEQGCSKLNFGYRQSQVRIPHLKVEQEMTPQPDVVVLDATRVDVWLGCRERYRKEYEEGTHDEPGEALKIGLDMHSLLGVHYSNLSKEKEIIRG